MTDFLKLIQELREKAEKGVNPFAKKDSKDSDKEDKEDKSEGEEKSEKKPKGKFTFPKKGEKKEDLKESHLTDPDDMLDALQNASGSNKKFDQALWDWFEENMADSGIYAGDATPDDYLDAMSDKQIKACYKELSKHFEKELSESRVELEDELKEAKFIYSNAEEELKKDDDLWATFLDYKKKLKSTHTIVGELDKKDKIISLELMPKSDYKQMADADKNWEDSMVRIFESRVELEDDEGSDYIWSKSELIELISSLDDEDIQDLGDFIWNELMYNEESDDFDELEDDDYEDDLDESIQNPLNEIKFFQKKKAQVDREKRKNKGERRKKAKLLAKYYKKNKARIKMKAKKYRKIAKRQPNKVKRHKA